MSKTNNNIDNQHYLNILIKLNKKSDTSQRKIAKDLGISLGKLNFCIFELKKKGLIKIKNFKKNENKNTYIYLLTPKGIMEKGKLTYYFNFLKLAR